MCFEFSLLIENPCRISSYTGFKHYDVTLPVACCQDHWHWSCSINCNKKGQTTQ